MTEQDRGPHQAEANPQQPQRIANNQGFLEAGEHLIGERLYLAEHLKSTDGALMVRLLPQPRREHSFGPGDAILS